MTHLGYRKGKRGGVWLVRWRSGAGYKQETIGTADDLLKAGKLSFAKAEAEARAIVERVHIEARAKADGEAPTVRSAVEAYVAVRNERDSKRAGRSVRSDADRRLTRHVLGRVEIRDEKNPGIIRKPAIAAAPLVGVGLHELKDRDLKTWLADLPGDTKQSSVERLASDLKAALNTAYDLHHEKLPPGLPTIISRGLAVKVEASEDLEIARDNQILSDSQVSALLAAVRAVDDIKGWEGDLYRLMFVMAETGMRFSQIARMRVRDVQRENGRVLVPVSRKGKGTKQIPHVAIPVSADLLDALQSVVTGRGAGEPLLERWRYGQAPGSIEWIKDRRGPWSSSSEFSRDWKLIRERVKLPHIDPYCLRHSSIVRKLRQNLSIRHVAALHDTSTIMIERHYSRYIVDGLEEIAARAVVSLAPPISNVVEISRRG